MITLGINRRARSEIEFNAVVMTAKLEKKVTTTITAKPIKWNEYKSEWTDDQYGFHIFEDREEDPENRFMTSWGENEGEYFQELKDAKEWCQTEINDWVRECAVVTVS